MAASHPARLLLLATAAAIAGGCGGTKVYRDEDFAPGSPYHREVAADPDVACEAATRALLGQGYALEESPPRAIRARKAFQPDQETNVILQFNVVCKGNRDTATVFANAVQTRYELKKTSQSTSLSVPSVGAISLPWGDKTEAQVQVGSETVSDPDFYDRFFALLERYLGQLREPAAGRPGERRPAPSARPDGVLH